MINPQSAPKHSAPASLFERLEPKRRMELEQKVIQILASCQIQEPPVPVHAIAQHLGVDIGYVRFDKLADQVAGFIRFEEKRIYVNADDTLTRRLFTIAHELGHWILHQDTLRQDPHAYQVLLREQKPNVAANNLESEANAFAAALLIPQDMLQRWRKLPHEDLCDLFAVSHQTLRRRREELLAMAKS